MSRRRPRAFASFDTALVSGAAPAPLLPLPLVASPSGSMRPASGAGPTASRPPPQTTKMSSAPPGRHPYVNPAVSTQTGSSGVGKLTPLTVAPPPIAPTPTAAPSPSPFNAACVGRRSSRIARRARTAKDLSFRGTDAAWTACAKSSIHEKPSGPIAATVHVRFSDNKVFKGATCTGCPGALATCIASSTKPTVAVTFKPGDATGDPEFDVPVSFLCD